MITVRRHRPGEEETLRRLCQETTRRINVHEYGPDLVEQWASRLEDPARWAARVRRENPLVAERDGAIVGFAEFSRQGRIGAFYCDHRCQGCGVGGALLDAVEAEASAGRIDAIQVDSSGSAAGFFERRGFVALEARETLTDGMPSRSMLLVKRRDRSVHTAPSDSAREVG